MTVTTRPGGESVLARIVADVRRELALRMTTVPFSQVEARAAAAPPPRDALPALRGDGLRVIAEVKRRSPAKGPLAPIPDPGALAGRYVAGGAAAISVLTEPNWFAGSPADLTAVRTAVEVPVLRKDFVVDPYQVWEARALGADLVLLIVAALDAPTLRSLLGQVHSLGMTALVEAHDQAEVTRAVEAGARLVGVNARDLRTLRIDMAAFAALAAGIPPDVVRVAESGIRGPADAAAYRAAGADAVLVGEAVVTSPDPAAAVAALAAAAATEAR
ncbi:indole-3-glycerol phosphate synthase TrpC [Plantactinospora endophytica]|uniref:Indole-3-glycerol phosphate synthase n=1 Tax=Plantactinospora endophytica TaxID=673535 RepID=A0ABQ4E6W9_9ACTN|nr:indole-3-glycerol phosphate synthase TrpC [Plantactinospora endophytica]GIG90425.1 indole-3-glycerol phosphate synthase [Plantactinospora endophytica]